MAIKMVQTVGGSDCEENIRSLVWDMLRFRFLLDIQEIQQGSWTYKSGV